MLEPISFMVLVKPEEVKKTTDSGIVLAFDESLEMKAQVLGKIVAFGPDFAKDYRPSEPRWGLKVGDRVFYAKYAGKWIKDPDTQEEFLVLRDEDLCAKVV